MHHRYMEMEQSRNLFALQGSRLGKTFKRTAIFLAIVVFILLDAPPVHAQKNAKKGPTSNKNYVKDTFTAKDGTSVDYWVMSPDKLQQGRKYPLVLALHGRGGSTTAATQLGSGAARK